MNRPDVSRARWRTSSYSGGHGACVNVAAADTVIVIRDSKDPHGPVLAFTSRAWRAFTGRVKNDVSPA